MSFQIILSFIVAMALAALLVPPVIKAGSKLGIIAKINDRTVHTQEIARIGGFGIYISFLVGVALFLQTDSQINSILLGGFLIFMIGLYDDIHDISPKLKLAAQLLASAIVIFYGDIRLEIFTDSLPFLPEIITLFWIIGITNAINLIDGLDGLSGGISVIVLVTISFTSLMSGRTDIASLSLILAGSTIGFLFYNFHPAKVFMGDCGALFLGFMIAVISLLGFGYSSSAFFTLGAPIIVLMVPILDTLIAIIRRKIKKRKFSEADKKHLHHRLMFKVELSHTKSVLVLYVVTILFSATSFLYLHDATLGIVMFSILMLMFELFVEATNMISRNFKPLLTLANIFIKSESLPTIGFVEEYRLKRTSKTKARETVIILLTLLIVSLSVAYHYDLFSPRVPEVEEVVQIPYVEFIGGSTLMDETYEKLVDATKLKSKDDQAQLVAGYFLQLYLSPKYNTQGINGLDYVHPSIRDDFEVFSLDTIVPQFETYPELEIVQYHVISYAPSHVQIEGFEDNRYYSALISYSYNMDSGELPLNTTVSLIEDEGIYYVVGIEYN